MEAAGLGFGVLPLGSKVYNEIKAYVDSVKNADSETLALLNHVRNGRRSIKLLDAIAKKNGPIDPELTILLTDVLREIQEELNAASRLVAKLRGKKDGEANEKSALTTQDAVQPLSKKSKLSFHWKREKLKKLESHLKSSNDQFNGVLHLYNTYSVSSSRDETSSFRNEVNHHFVTLNGTIASLAKVHGSLQSVAEVDHRFIGPSMTPLETSKSLTWSSVDSVKTLVVNGSPDQEGQEDSSICRCRPKHQRKGASGGTKWLSLYKQEKTTVAHDIGCPYYGLEESQVEKSYTVTVNGRYFWDRLSTAVALSVNVPTDRFGSWSISPQMRTYNTIDLEKSPAMRLFHLADDLDDVDWDDPAVERKTRSYWHRRLLELFRTGKASPFDVDHRTNKPMVHFLRVSSRRRMKPYVRLVWETLHQLNFPEHMLLCNGLKPWAYHFSTSHPIKGTKLYAEFLPWNMDRWLEPEDIPESLLGPSVSADIALSRAFILAMIMHERRSLLEASNIGLLCQAIILRSIPKALEILDDNVSSWTEPFLNDEGGICAIDLAIMWFPELMNALLQEDVSSDSRLGRLPLPRPHPSKYSFLEVAVNTGLQHGERHGKATTQEYLHLIDFALKKDYPIYFDRISLHLADAEEMVTAHLADRRRRLLELAKKRLPPASYSLDIFEPKFVDENVEEVLQAFTTAEVMIPEGLKPRDIQDPQPLSGSVFEYAWHSEDLCDRLQELGFDPDGFVRSRCRNGPFPMAPMMAPLEWDCWRFLWLEDLIAESKTEIGHTVISYEKPARSPLSNSPSSSRLTMVGHTDDRDCEQAPTILHALMAFVGRCMPGKLWSGFIVMPSDDLSPFVKPYLLQHVEDDCLCPCTISGCKPLSMFVKSVLTGHGKSFDLFLERVTYLFQILEMIFDAEGVSSGLTIDVLRICTFDCLGCRHTCCHDSMRDYIFGYSRMLSPGHFDPEELQEIHDEDKEDLNRLEKIMQDVDVKLQDRNSTSLHFVQSQWMPMMRRTVEERNETNLSAVEIERIREVGVTWENVVIPRRTKQDWYDDDADSAISLNLDRAETDEDRMSAITRTIDKICA